MFSPEGIHMCYTNRYTSPCQRFLKLVLTSVLYSTDTFLFREVISFWSLKETGTVIHEPVSRSPRQITGSSRFTHGLSISCTRRRLQRGGISISKL